MEDVVLAIDAGTTSTRAAFIACTDGTVLGSGVCSVPTHCLKSGWAEQDPQHWANALLTSVQEAITQLTEDDQPPFEMARIKAVAVVATSSPWMQMGVLSETPCSGQMSAAQNRPIPSSSCTIDRWTAYRRMA